MAKKQHTYNSGRIYRANSQPAHDGKFTAATVNNNAPKKQRAKKSTAKKALTAAVIVLLLAGAIIGGLFIYLNSLLDPGNFGRITQNDPTYNYVPREYNKKDVLHLLIVGIDNEEGRDYGEGLGLTDMILYCQFDFKSGQLNMLQVPRDSFVGDNYSTGGTGKINALLISGADKDAPIRNIAGAFEEMFRLPVDHFISIDMDGMHSIVNILGPLRVYVSKEMQYAGSYLAQGWQWLDADASEFFVRNRKGPGFERSDIDRLDNQRHFYSALFRRFLNLAPQDIVKLLPVFEYYCNTDIPATDIFDIAFSALSLKSENVLFCKVPGTTGPALDPSGKERSLYFVDLYGRGTQAEPGLANLLNEHFRAGTQPQSAEELGLPQLNIPSSYTLYPPNIQQMGEVQEGEGGADVDVEPTA